MDRYVEQYRTELARKDKKIQSQSSHILRLTQHNKRSNERLNELQRCLDQIKGTITGQNTFDQMRDILRFVGHKILTIPGKCLFILQGFSDVRW